MAQKDLSEKILEDYNDVFADNVNAVIFKGEQRVTPESLTNSSVHSQYRADDKKLHEQERDVIKYWNKNSVKIAICGIENQSNPDKAMPIRVFGYEGASYRQQLSSSENNNTNDRKTYIPVVTLILYFGTKTRWCKKRSLKKILAIPEGLENYVNDIHVNVCEIAWLSDEEIERFHSDFKIVAKYFKNKRINSNYIPDDTQEIVHVDEMLKLLSVMTGDERFEIIRTSNSIGGIKNMCEVLDRVENRGIEKANIEIAIKMINKDYSLKEIHELTNLSLEQIKELQLANK